MVTKSYTPSNQLRSQSYATAQTSETLSYRLDGNVAEKTCLENGTQVSHTSFDYTTDGMLSSEVRTGENAYSKTYTYDARGNCSGINANDGTTAYSYDANNRMTDFESAEHKAHYTYNPDGMRRSKAVDSNPVTMHLWNGSEIVAEVGGVIPSVPNTYIYGLDRKVIL